MAIRRFCDLCEVEIKDGDPEFSIQINQTVQDVYQRKATMDALNGRNNVTIEDNSPMTCFNCAGVVRQVFEDQRRSNK